MGKRLKAKNCWAEANRVLAGVTAAALLTLLLMSPAFADTPWFSPYDAKNQVGETIWICGVVGSARHAPSVRGEPTYINLGPAYPDHVFTILVWGSDRHKFEYRLENLDGGLCVRGRVEMYDGTPQIVVREPSQIQRSR